MTDLPPPNDDEELDDPWHDRLLEVSDDYGAPDVLALVALVLAVASLFGFGLLNGSPYFVPFITNDDGQKTRLVLAALLGGAFAVAPVWLGFRSVSRRLETDPAWTAAAARAAVVLGLIALVLRLILAIVAAAADDPTSIARL